MDWSMLWKDVIGGFLIAGFLAVMLAMVETFSFNYTFWLNVLAAIAVAWYAYLNRKEYNGHGPR